MIKELFFMTNVNFGIFNILHLRVKCQSDLNKRNLSVISVGGCVVQI
jgi:hypothetical protein